MNSVILRMLKDVSTGIDGQSFDVGRVIGLIASFAYIGMGAYGLTKITSDHPFPYQDFGIGFGAIAGGVGALLKLKEGSEPKGDDRKGGEHA